jgi:steroid delta-isomerase-like uncharacterized protein
MELPQIVRTYIDTFNRHDMDACLATFAPDGTYSDPGTTQPLSGQALKDHFDAFLTGFPDATFETVAVYAISENLAVWRWVYRGTNTGSYRGLPVTGRSVSMPGCEFIAVRDAKIHWVEGYFDRLSLLVQLGLAPHPQAGAAS